MSFGQSGDILDSRTEEPGMERECPVCTPKGTTGPEGIPEYKHDFGDGGYKPADKLDRIASYIEGTRLSIRGYPYKGGIEDLRTTLICTLNALSEVVTYLKRSRIDSPEKALHMIIECKDYLRRCDNGRGNPEAS